MLKKRQFCRHLADFTSSDSEDEESNLEEIEGVECISSSEDEAEFPCSIPAGSEVDCVNVEQCGETALGGSQVSVTTSEKCKRSRSEGELNANLGSQVLDPDDTDLLKNATVNPAPSRETLLYMLRENNLNWFTFAKELETMLPVGSQVVLNQILIDFADYIPFSDLTVREEQLVEVSRQAYLEDQRKQALDNEIFETESESEDGDWCQINDILSNKAKAQIQQAWRKIKRAATRETSKKIAKEALLQRKIPKRVPTFLTKYPDIGDKMEEFVREHRVGAGQWRRTGVFTFTSNKNTQGPKVTYKRLQEHLQKEYNTSISYGTVVQLCSVRNRRRISTQRYKGVAAITCRRARKGFDVKFNPDSHWSCCFYKGLDIL